VDRHGVVDDRVDVAPRRFHVGQQPLERGLLPLPVPWLAQIVQLESVASLGQGACSHAKAAADQGPYVEKL
jgi:hypothetical protein